MTQLEFVAHFVIYGLHGICASQLNNIANSIYTFTQWGFRVWFTMMKDETGVLKHHYKHE